MSNTADLYKKKQREREKAAERKRREERTRQAREAAQEAKEREEERRREAKSLAARKRTLNRSGLLNMLKELKRKLGFAYTIDHNWSTTDVVVGQVGTAEYPRWEKTFYAGELGWSSAQSSLSDKWKVIYGAEVLVSEDGIHVKDSTDYKDLDFSAADDWSGLEDALVDAIHIGIKHRGPKKKLRKTRLFGL